MMSYLLSLQRASWKWRVVAFIVMVMTISQLRTGWAYLHDDLALVHWYGWSLLFPGVWIFCDAFVVALVGRLPKSLLRRPGGLSRTLPQIHADIAKEQLEQREKSRQL
jgi:uncharacterized membrane protein